MKITSIQQQVRQKDRYSVFVDGAYSFSLSETSLLESKLVSGQQIDAAQLKSFKQLSLDDKAFGNALRYVVRRPRSVWEVRNYLRRRQAAESVAEKIINRLTQAGLLNDEVFARLWVDNRRVLKPTSRRKLVLELKQKHVPEEVIASILASDKETTDERSVLRELVERKRHRYQDKQKFMMYLSRQGYGYDDIRSVLSAMEDKP